MGSPVFAFCTYCSHRKSLQRADLPAIRRYRSPRIARVWRAARMVGAGFLIISGEYGLLPPEQRIPWYDHLLKPDEVDALAERVAGQLRQRGVAGIAYFTVAVAQEPQVEPYQLAIKSACQIADIPLLVMEMPTK